MPSSIQNVAELAIRDMKAADISAVAEIEAAVQPYQAWTVQSFKDAYMSCYTMTVAELKAKIVGYAVVLMAPDVGELLLIGVSPDHQSMGVGQRLMLDVEQRIRAKLLTAVMLEVRQSNAQAQRFYEKQGFVSVGRRKNYYQSAQGEREDALLLRKTLLQDDM